MPVPRDPRGRSWSATRSCITSLLGIDPIPLGSAPFALATDRSVRTTAAELGIKAHPGARVYVLPVHRRPRRCRHGGGDPGRDAAPRRPNDAAWSTSGRTPRSCSATATACSPRRARPGPAFEGAQISGGQRAAPGAIERVRIDRATLEPRFKIIGSRPVVRRARLRRRERRARGDRDLRLGHRRGDRRAVPRRRDHDRRDRRRPAGRDRTARIVPDGRTFSYVLHDGQPADRHHPERRAGDPARQGRALRRRPTADGPRRRRVRRPTSGWPARSAARSITTHAMVLGLIPDCDLDHVRSAGNAAGTGALIALLSGSRADRDRGGRPARREDRDRGRAALPGALRRRRWHSRTRPPASDHLARVVDLPLPSSARHGRRRRPLRHGDAGRS